MFRVHFYFTTYKKVFSKIFTRIQSYYIRKCDFQKKKNYGSFLVRIFPIRVNIFRAVRTRNTRRQYDRQLTARIITFFYKKMLYLQFPVVTGFETQFSPQFSSISNFAVSSIFFSSIYFRGDLKFKKITFRVNKNRANHPPRLP